MRSEQLTVVVHAQAPALVELASDLLAEEGMFRPIGASENHESVWGSLLVGEVDLNSLPTSIGEADVLALTAPAPSELVASLSAPGRLIFDASAGETEALADQALALLLGGLKTLPAADEAVRTGKWRLDGVSGDLWGARVGLAGASAFAKSEVGRRLRAFECHVVELIDQRNGLSTACDSWSVLDLADLLEGSAELDALVLLDGASRWISQVLGVNQSRLGADTVVVDLGGGIPGHGVTCGQAVTLGALLDRDQGSGPHGLIGVACGRDWARLDEGRALRSAVAWLVAVASCGPARRV